MPEHFDPSWEYFVPDSEIAELIGDTEKSFDLLGLDEWRVSKHRSLLGFRFGKGDPNFFSGRLGKEKKVRSTESRWRSCVFCGGYFEARHDKNTMCSNACRLRSLWKNNQQEEQKSCSVCHSLFLPKSKNSLYCSRKCLHKNHRMKNKEQKVNNDQKFLDLFHQGVLLKHIADRLGVSVPTAKRMRQRLDLVNRRRKSS